jgi:DNA-binding winged helix-turn-helix (wHTH) protein
MGVTVRFGRFTFDSDRRVLRRDDVDVHLTPKAFDLLALLIQEAPRVLRKTELHERLWPDSFVSEATLVGLVKELRRALDDRDVTSRLIRTAFGVGYAFCGNRREHWFGDEPAEAGCWGWELVDCGWDPKDPARPGRTRHWTRSCFNRVAGRARRLPASCAHHD